MTQLTQRFSDAVALANELHADQARKGSGVPYLSHLLRVAGIALEHAADEDEAIAAVLHDAVEDQGGAATRAILEERFGPRVAQIVDACSDTDQTPKPPWRERKEAYLAHLRTADASARLVSAADKLDNARSILEDYRHEGEALWKLFRGGRDGTLWYYRSVVEILRQTDDRRIVGELDRIVTELERLAAETPIDS